MQIRVSEENFQYRKGKQRASHDAVDIYVQYLLAEHTQLETNTRVRMERAQAGGHVQHSLGMTQLHKQDQPHGTHSF